MQDRKNLHRLQFTGEEKGAPRLKERPKTEQVLVPEQSKGKGTKQAVRPGKSSGAPAPETDKGVKRPSRPQQDMAQGAEKAVEQPASQEQPKMAQRPRSPRTASRQRPICALTRDGNPLRPS